VSYAEVALAALLPAVLYYAALFIQADLEAARLGISRVSRADMPEKKVVLSGLHFLLAFVVLIATLFLLFWQHQRSALVAAMTAAVTSLIFGYQAVRHRLATLLSVFETTGIAVVEIIIISAAAGIVIGVLNVTGLSFNLTYALVQ